MLCSQPVLVYWAIFFDYDRDWCICPRNKFNTIFFEFASLTVNCFPDYMMLYSYLIYSCKIYFYCFIYHYDYSFTHLLITSCLLFFSPNPHARHFELQSNLIPSFHSSVHPSSCRRVLGTQTLKLYSSTSAFIVPFSARTAQKTASTRTRYALTPATAVLY